MASVDIQVDIHCVLNEKNDDIYVNDLFNKYMYTSWYFFGKKDKI